MNGSGSKGQALASVHDSLQHFRVPEYVLFSCSDWAKSPESIIEKVATQLGGKALAVRSSAFDEDGASRSQAGRYESVLNVPPDDEGALRLAITRVVYSYLQQREFHDHDEVLVQEMIRDVALSGVVFTHEMGSGAPYYVINYDDSSGRTNTVTSGSGEHANRTLYVHRDSLDELRSERFRALLQAVLELEIVTGTDTLDIEFILDNSLQPYLLQFRAITTEPNWNRGLVRRINTELDGIQSFVRERFRPIEGVFGSTTAFGQMPDWNPAEIIGRVPRALALTLYQHLVTDRAWRVARHIMGYSTPVGMPLMVSLAGQPYIDVRMSFHSYLPAELPPSISERLVDSWVEQLCERPELHDKVEFDVAVTSFTFDVDERIVKLCGSLDRAERDVFADALKNLTRRLVLGSGEGSIKGALSRVERLSQLPLPDPRSGPLGLMQTMEQCIDFGTVPFAILARHGFIARSFMLSLVNRGILSSTELDLFQTTIPTVATELLEQIELVRLGSVQRVDFMNRFGHLRPGTYDILSPRYDASEILDSIPQARANLPQMKETPFFAPTQQQNRDIDGLLEEASFHGFDSSGLFEYLRSAIAGREYGKFVFTRFVSAMLELVAKFGEEHGLSREEMSHIPVQDILRVGTESGGGQSVEERLRRISERNAERYNVTTAIRLPQMLFDEASVRVVPFQVSQPNFITGLRVVADTFYLSPYTSTRELVDRIVLIDNADPGYDWIFSLGIAGLITKYGGANSHMAIRCAEFGIPAAIGCGEQRFDALVAASRVGLDCAARTIEVLH